MIPPRPWRIIPHGALTCAIVYEDPGSETGFQTVADPVDIDVAQLIVRLVHDWDDERAVEEFKKQRHDERYLKNRLSECVVCGGQTNGPGYEYCSDYCKRTASP